MQAAITVIGRRPAPFDEGLDFKRTNLIAYDFSKLNFQNSDFTGTFLDYAKMDGAFFINSVIRHAFLRHATMKNANFDLSSFDDCRFDRAQIDRTSFKSTVMVDTDLRRANVSSIHLEDADLRDAFGYGLQFAVENVKDLGTSYLNGQELLGVFQLFQKATFDEKTTFSQHARDAIAMMTATSKAS